MVKEILVIKSLGCNVSKDGNNEKKPSIVQNVK